MANTNRRSSAGSGGTKKKTATKSSSSARKPAGKKKKSSQGTIAAFVKQREFKAGLIFVIGLLLLIISVFPGGEGSGWNRLYMFYYAVFGLVGCYLPAAILFLSVVNVLNRNKPVYIVKAAELLLLFIGICGFIHINNEQVNSIEGYGATIRYVYNGIMTYQIKWLGSGGVIGAVFGGGLYKLGDSRAIANVLCIIYIIAVLMFLFGITLFKLFTDLEKPVKKAGEYTGQAIEKTKSDYAVYKKERAAAKAQRGEIAALEATRVVTDFYSGDAANKRKQKTDAPAVQTADESSTQAPTQKDFDIVTIFGRTTEKKAAPKTEEAPAAVQKPADAAAHDLFALAEQQTEEKKEEEKQPPLTAEEAAAVAGELNEAMEEKPVREYVKPPLECLRKPVVSDKNYDLDELQANGEKLIAALDSFNVSASIVDVVPGPTVTRYELAPAPGVKISKFTGLADDLALHMAAPAGLRIEAPIPNKAAIGIEIPNRKKASVSFREVIDNDDFRGAKSKLNAALGKNISGDVVYTDIAKMPHLLVAGTTGSGKSVCMNTMIVSLLYNAGPDEVRMILIDPKQVEFGKYNGIPHLLVPVVSDPRKAAGALGWAVTEMLSRYKTLNANGVRDIKSYNSLCEGNEELQKMPQIVIFIDELADLMTVAPAEVEDSIQRIAQMGRAAGMHLVIATQRPSVDVITGVIKANIPSRIALTVKSQIDSRTMIDQAGAEKLMGYGDMLYYPVGVPKPIRVQGAFIADEEIDNIVEFLKANSDSQYDDNVQQEIERQAAADKKKTAEEKASAELDKNDDLLMRAIELFVSAPEKASISALQRHLGLGFAKAGRLMDTLEEKGVVGPTEGSKPRKVLLTKAQWYEMSAMSSDVTEGLSDSSMDFTDISDPNE